MATDAYTRMLQIIQRQQAKSEFLIGSVVDEEHIVAGGNQLDVGDDIFLLGSVDELQEDDEVLVVQIEPADDSDETYYIALGIIQGRDE